MTSHWRFDKALDYVGDYQLKSACKDAICIAPSKITQMIFAVLEDWYHHIVLTHSCKLVSFFYIFRDRSHWICVLSGSASDCRLIPRNVTLKWVIKSYSFARTMETNTRRTNFITDCLCISIFCSKSRLYLLVKSFCLTCWLLIPCALDHVEVWGLVREIQWSFWQTEITDSAEHVSAGSEADWSTRSSAMVCLQSGPVFIILSSLFVSILL